MIFRRCRRISVVIRFQCLLQLLVFSFLPHHGVHGTQRRNIDLLSTKAILHQHQRRLQQQQQQHASNSSRARSSSTRRLNVLNRHLQETQSTRHLSRYEIQFRNSHGINLQLDWNGDYEHFIDIQHEIDDNDDDDDFIEEWMTSTSSDSNPSIREQNTQIIQHPISDCIPNCTETNDVTNTDNNHRRVLAQKFNHPVSTTTSTTTSSSMSKMKGGGSGGSGSGGQFNSYQAVPLSQGYGTHIANVWVGSPNPQRKTVIVDTGSHYTAFPCTGCKNCGRPHHTDPYYNPKKSNTFHQLQCDECRGGIICDTGRCLFSQAYTEGSSWDAVQVKDRFYCGGMDVLDSVDPIDERYSIDFMFGCITRMSGLFITQLADGIMGMSAHQATLPKQLWDHGLLEHNLFSMCFRRELGTSKRGVTAGSMTLGGVSTNLDTSPIVYARNMAKSGWFTVYVKNIFVRSNGGQSALTPTDTHHKTVKVKINVEVLNSGKGVIVDSGTTDTYLNKAVAPAFREAWVQATGQSYSHMPLRLTEVQLRSLPTILVQCHAYSPRLDPSVDDYSAIPGYTGKLDPSSPSDLLIAIPATSYMDFSTITGLYTSRLYFTETSGGVLGSNTMQGHNVVFDWANGRVGFAESSCTYDKKNIPKVADDDGFSADCVISNPILSTTCLDSVDQDICKNHPTNIALLGTENWTAIVESPGTSSGITCLEAARGMIVVNDFEDPVVSCDGTGVCEEARPCSLTCSQMLKAREVVPTPQANQHLGCGDSYWSACDRSCAQTRIISMAHSDGKCHEVTRMTRPCHIDACAREDPCLVPFLIHTILGFRGLSVLQWSETSEDVVASGLAQAALALHGKSIFEAGDVNVLMALPWYLDEDHPDAATTPSMDAVGNQAPYGVKVVLEIAIVNRNTTSVVNESSAIIIADEEEEDEGSMASILRNFTDRIALTTPVLKCHEENLYSLARDALTLKRDVILHSQFMSMLLQEMSLADDSKQDSSPFTPLYSSDLARNESRVISAWSIRTHVSDEINYFGPKKPWWYAVLRFVHALTFGMTVFLIAWSAWSLVATHLVQYYNDHRRWRPSFILPSSLMSRGSGGGGGSGRYSPVNTTEQENTENKGTVGAGNNRRANHDLEMSVHSDSSKRLWGTGTKKRRAVIATLSSDSFS